MADERCDIPKRLGDFQILRELGRGGMGIVYEARQCSLNRMVALKLLSSGLGLTAKAVMRFRREAEAAAKLHHTNIVPIYATGEEHRIHYYAMELIEGPSLDQVIRHIRQNSARGTDNSPSPDTDVKDTPGKLPEWVADTMAYRPAAAADASDSSGKSPRLSGPDISSSAKYFDSVAQMIADVADALEHAHQQGVIHRDIKPSNLLLSSDGRLSINDFGLARILEQPGVTVSGEFVGSPLYMSPEQISAGRAPIDHRTDIYSLGATLFELITLQPPFPGTTRDEVIARILHKEPARPRRLNKRIPQDLETICLKAIDRDPDRRYATAADFAADLRNYVNRFAISARRIGPLGRGVKWVRRHPSMTALIAVVVVSLAVVLGFREHYRAREITDAENLVLAYSMGGNFQKAQIELERIEQLGPTAGLVELLRGQIEILQGEYSRARDHFRTARNHMGPSIRTSALLAISHFYAGEEATYVRSLEELQDVRPITAEDFFYLGFAHNWAQPHTALQYLNEAERAGTPNALIRLVRGNAEQHCAMDAVDQAESLKFARNAIKDATIALGSFPDNPYVLSTLAIAHTVAATRLQQPEDADTRRQDLEAAELIAKSLENFPGNSDAIFARYHVLQQSGRDIEASRVLCGVKREHLDNYLRAFRIIAWFPQSQLSEAEDDFRGISESGDNYKEGFLVLARLAASPSDEDRQKILGSFRNYIATKMGSDLVFNMEIDWAVLRLLNQPDEASRVGVFMKNRIQPFDSSFIRNLDPVCDFMANPVDPDRLISSCRHSRRALTPAYFAMGIDALARGDRQGAMDSFRNCREQGFFMFYAYQWSISILEKMKSDERWPHWIEPTKPKGGAA